MPPGRKHFRRSRDAPSCPFTPKPGVNGGPNSRKRLGTSPSCQRAVISVAESACHTKCLMITKGVWIRGIAVIARHRRHRRHREIQSSHLTTEERRHGETPKPLKRRGTEDINRRDRASSPTPPHREIQGSHLTTEARRNPKTFETQRNRGH
jgi:hypothetical protein